LLVHPAFVLENKFETFKQFPCQKSFLQHVFYIGAVASFHSCFIQIFKRSSGNKPRLTRSGKRIHCVHPLLNNEKSWASGRFDFPFPTKFVLYL